MKNLHPSVQRATLEFGQQRVYVSYREPADFLQRYSRLSEAHKLEVKSVLLKFIGSVVQFRLDIPHF